MEGLVGVSSFKSKRRAKLLTQRAVLDAVDGTSFRNQAASPRLLEADGV